MTTWQAFFLGVMAALLPSMVFLAVSLRSLTEVDGDLTTK